MEKVTKKDLYIDNNTKSTYLWRGLGGNFSSLTSILNELVDNACSNLKASYDSGLFLEKAIKQVFVRIIEEEKGLYKVEVEDTGTGITELAAALSIGDRSAGQTSLNEHGFGMKNALSAANPNNDNWSIKTRTHDDVRNDEYTEVRAPFILSRQPITKFKGSTAWEGIHQTGTIVTFYIKDDLLRTIAIGLKGNYKKLDSLAEVLAEDLGYTYRTYIKKGICSLTLQYKSSQMSHMVTKNISTVEPSIQSYFDPACGHEEVDLGKGKVKIDYEFCTVKESNYKKHYLANMSTSGVEIRVNGRVLADNLFSEIWGVEKHNSYNHILIRLDIESEFAERLPSTTTNKAGLKQDDPKLEKIYDWIRLQVKKPLKKAELADDEKDLFDILMEKKMEIMKGYPLKVLEMTREKVVFQSLGGKVRADLYEKFEVETGSGEVAHEGVVYEGKKKQTSVKDVYQLLMYWDGLVKDGVTVTKGILMAKEHPEAVKELVKAKNKALDINGKKYNLELETWQSRGIYPKS